jgi:hypothetical protein
MGDLFSALQADDLRPRSMPTFLHRVMCSLRTHRQQLSVEAIVRKWLVAVLLVAFFTPLFATTASAEDSGFYGMLRGRDLTPFGYLRLDMRPGFAPEQEPGTMRLDTDFGYQNTWATSHEVERYLNSLDRRRELGPEEWQAIRDLPGENYLVDLELAQFDLTFNYQFNDRWSGYAIVSGATFGGGVLDGVIEKFHRMIDAPRFGRPAAARNDFNLLFDLESSQYTAFEQPGYGGLLDPVFGVRYTRPVGERWRMSLESAIKIPVAERDRALSTGRMDVGAQISLQRFGARNAFYANAAAVYYSGMKSFVPEPAQLLPTVVIGYERRMTPRTNLVFQGYVSRSVYTREQTNLDELLGTKIQLSGGVHHRRGAHLLTFAITENIGNINNTPDIGVQFGWSINPGWN